MNLRLEQGEISLPMDFRFDISSNHPFFSDKGTSSVPVTLPPSPQNRALLGNPENQHRAKRFTKKLPGTLSHGIYTKRCNVVIDSASQKKGVSVSLALQESEMYAELQDKRLPDILATGKTFDTDSPATLLSGMATSLSKEYILLPVAADAEDADNADATGSKKVITTILNNNLDGSLVTGSGEIRVADETVETPPRYGIAPFMPLWSLLQKMFEYSFYTVERNVFATDPVLSQIVVLHNTADALILDALSGDGDVRQLLFREGEMVPSVTVGEMIEWIRTKFGAFVSVNGKRVSIRLLRDVLALAPDRDLSPYMEDEYTLTHPDPAMLRCSCQHDIDSSKPAADTLEDLRARYNAIVNVTSPSGVVGAGLFYIKPLGKFYYRQTASSTMAASLLGTDAFDYYRQKDCETMELESDDSFVPMVQYSGKYLPFIGESIRRHLDTKDKETDAEQALMICYARSYNGKNYGTLYPYNPTGGAVSAQASCPDLTPEGLAPYFFSGYRDLLLNAAPTITCKLDIPLTVLTAMDLWTPKILNHSKVLLKSLKYSISESGVSSCDAELQVLSSFTDAEEITDPVFGSQNLAWRIVNTRTVFASGTEGKYKKYVKISGTDGLADYTMADAPTYTPSRPGLQAKKRQRWVRVIDHRGYKKNWFNKGYTETIYTHYYYEYFESYNQE